MDTRDRQPARPDLPAEGSPAQPFVVRLPSFVLDEPAGLGDVIKRATAQLGMRPCGGCARRAATLNRWILFAGQRSV